MPTRMSSNQFNKIIRLPGFGPYCNLMGYSYYPLHTYSYQGWFKRALYYTVMYKHLNFKQTKANHERFFSSQCSCELKPHKSSLKQLFEQFTWPLYYSKNISLKVMPTIQLSHICFLGLCSAVFHTYPGGLEWWRGREVQAAERERWKWSGRKDEKYAQIKGPELSEARMKDGLHSIQHPTDILWQIIQLRLRTTNSRLHVCIWARPTDKTNSLIQKP